MEDSSGSKCALAERPPYASTSHHSIDSEKMGQGRHEASPALCPSEFALSAVMVKDTSGELGAVKAVYDTMSFYSWASESFVARLGLSPISLGSLASAAVITQYGTRESKLPGAISLLTACTTLNSRALEVVENPSADIFVSSCAIWALTSMHFRHVHRKDRFQDHAIIAGVGVGLGGHLIRCAHEGRWGSFGVCRCGLSDSGGNSFKHSIKVAPSAYMSTFGVWSPFSQSSGAIESPIPISALSGSYPDLQLQNAYERVGPLHDLSPQEPSQDSDGGKPQSAQPVNLPRTYLQTTFEPPYSNPQVAAQLAVSNLASASRHRRRC
ncbi:hypothetical protein BDZ45DRAFT_754924 [Acephala macrosclerotiorum]|nr:hypothetical protein BDZ45DRAFT_754924 [Acephala macrosclerotiorum]